MSKLMDQMVVKEWFQGAFHGDCELPVTVEMGVGEDDPFLYLTITIDEVSNLELCLEIGVSPTRVGVEDETYDSFVQRLQKIVDAVKQNAINFVKQRGY